MAVTEGTSQVEEWAALIVAARARGDAVEVLARCNEALRADDLAPADRVALLQWRAEAYEALAAYQEQAADLKAAAALWSELAARYQRDAGEREAQLALLNTVMQATMQRQGLAEVYEVVGDQIRDLFAAQVVAIYTFDRERGLAQPHYIFENGRRYESGPHRLGPASRFVSTGQPLVINENLVERLRELGGEHPRPFRETQMPKSAVFVPLVHDGEVMGYLSIQNIDREHAFSDADVHLLVSVATNLSLVLANARLLEETQQRNAELRIINSVQEALAANRDMQAIYDVVGAQITAVFDAQSVVVAALDPDTGVGSFPFVWEHGRRYYPAPKPLAEIVSAQRMAEDSRPIKLDTEAQFDAMAMDTIEGTAPSKSGLFVPLLVGDRTRGGISVQNVEQEHAFSDADLRLLVTIAGSLSLALENARLFNETERLFQEAQRRAREMSALAEVGREVSSSLDLPTVLERIASYARDLLVVDDCGVFLPDESGAIMKGYVALGTIAPQVKATTVVYGQGIIGDLWQRGEAQAINAVQSDPRALLISGTQSLSDEKMMVAPLMSAVRVTGMMAVWRIGGEPFEQADLDFLVGLARQAAIAIENARLYSEADVARRAAEEANQAKSAFLANVSHELRTPLTSMAGFAHVITTRLQQRIFPLLPPGDDRVQRAAAQVQESLEIIVAEGERLTALVNNVLDLERIEAGKMTWQEELLDMAAVLRSGINGTRAIIEQQELALHEDIASDLPPVLGDRDKLVQVVINLLSNAAKFTPRGSITVGAGHVGDELVVRVADSGPGIAAADLGSIFEKFHQVGDTLTEKPRGTGLGLSISREIIDHHGGRIWAESEPGQGSVFSFAIPTAGARRAKTAAVVDEVSGERSNGEARLEPEDGRSA